MGHWHVWTDMSIIHSTIASNCSRHGILLSRWSTYFVYESLSPDFVYRLFLSTHVMLCHRSYRHISTWHTGVSTVFKGVIKKRRYNNDITTELSAILNVCCSNVRTIIFYHTRSNVGIWQKTLVSMNTKYDRGISSKTVFICDTLRYRKLLRYTKTDQ